MKSTTVFAAILLQWSSCGAFVCQHTCSSRQSSHNVILKVYTPEQEADEKAREEVSTSDEVLQSLVEKLDQSKPQKVDNKAMAFLRKMGKVGGAANKDFSTAVGSDEGSGMAAPKNTASNASIRKATEAYKECTETGLVDDMSETFPRSCTGREWRGVADRIRGGTSEGFLQRQEVEGRNANVLKGHVSLNSAGTGFLQMVVDLPMDPSKPSVDASDFDGLELDILSKEGLQFNVHMRTAGALDQASFRHTEELEVLFSWQTVRIPFSSFVSEDGKTVDYSKLKRIGIVVLDQETDVELAVSGVRFYSVI